MDLGLTDEQKAIQQTARRFARERLLPTYLAREKAGVFDRGLLKEMGDIGLLGAGMPAEYGGSELEELTVGLIAEECAYGDFGIGNFTLMGSLMGRIIHDYADPEIAHECLPKMAAGEFIVALGLTEPRGGSDAANLQLRAVKDGDDYVLNGEKTGITSATIGDAVVLFARTGDAALAAKGVTAFYVPLDLPGIAKHAFECLGERTVGWGNLQFDDVRIPARYKLGDENRGFLQVMQGFDVSRVLLGLMCVGAAQASVDETWQYIQDREAFKMPLAKFQGVTFPLAEAETYLTAARELCYRTLWQRDEGLPHTAEAAMCKWWPPKIACEIALQCLLLHGHYGYTTDLPHQQRWRDVLGIRIGDGTEEIMKMIIAREKIGRVALQY